MRATAPRYGWLLEPSEGRAKRGPNPLRAVELRKPNNKGTNSATGAFISTESARRSGATSDRDYDCTDIRRFATCRCAFDGCDGMRSRTDRTGKNVERRTGDVVSNVSACNSGLRLATRQEPARRRRHHRQRVSRNAARSQALPAVASTICDLAVPHRHQRNQLVGSQTTYSFLLRTRIEPG